VARQNWHGIWGLPIPEDTASLLQKFPYIEVEIETWEYGEVAQIVHRGPCSEEGQDIDYLKDFILAQGSEIAGALEEEFIVGPEPAIQRTIVRYPIRARRDMREKPRSSPGEFSRQG
jgi:hypothetical protein